MIVAIDKEYKKISDDLKGLGYTIADIKTKSAVDAILYDSSKNIDFLNYAVDMSIKNQSKYGGVLMIDIKGKNASDIHRILSKRLYTPLF